MKIIGITRVRNEGHIILNTLDHVSQFVDQIHVFDDASEDNTVELCLGHPKVKRLIQNTNWNATPKGRARAEGVLRQQVYISAMYAGADWVYCFDADEYVEFVDIDFINANNYYFSLFDFYITSEDVHKSYLDRKWMGPEYRDIPMLFKTNPNIRFAQRIPRGLHNNMKFGGYVKHYGKAISTAAWEETCNYYVNVRWRDRRPDLRKRWADRRGKAVHIESDFGRPLITWEDRNDLTKIVKL